MLDFIQRILRIGDYSFKRTFGATRSSEWPRVREEHLKKEPFCQVCGGKKKLNVHHIRPFHVHPELELDPTNLITLCNGSSGTISCHIRFGHLDNFKEKWNPSVREESKEWKGRFDASNMDFWPVDSNDRQADIKS